MITQCQESGTDDEFCQHIANNYNLVVDTFRMKWRGLESTQGQFVTEHPDNLIAWASSHNLAVRGHSLLWAKKKNNPTWTHSLFGLEFEEAVYKHIDETMIHFNKVGVRDWDVINEMVDQGVTNHTFYMDQSGNPNIRAEVHKYVRSSFPDNRLFVNDYGILVDSNGRFSMFQQLIRDLLAAGAPIDGIGLQSHLKGFDTHDWNVINTRVETLWEEFRIPMWVTEFDWNGDLDEPDVPWDYEEYARILDDFYTLMFSQEGIFGIVAWKQTTYDFVSKTPNVAGEAYLRLYNDQWRTTGLVTPTESSSVEIRGFKGDYTIQVRRGAEELAEVAVSLTEDMEVTCTYQAGGMVCA